MTVSKYFLASLLPGFLWLCLNGSDTSIPPHPIQTQDNLATNYEQASFPGGAKAWVKHIRAFIKAPELPCDIGSVSLRFIVRKTGKLDSIEVIRGLCESADQNAIHILKNSPLWNPSIVNGKAVDDKMMVRVPYHFR